MSEIKLVGTQHHEPEVEKRTVQIVEKNDFDTVYVEGVDEATGREVQEAVDNWKKLVKQKTGLELPEDVKEDGRFREAKALEQEFNGDITYLDDLNSIFTNTKETVMNDLKRAHNGELRASPGILVENDIGQAEMESVMRMYSPDPDLPYDIFDDSMTEEDYRQHIADSFVDLYRSHFADAGYTLSEDHEEQVRSNVVEHAPDQERLRQLMVEDVYSNDSEQEREETWMENFESNYDGERTAVFVGLAHIDEDNDSFYNKLVDNGYSVDRHTLKDFKEF